MEFQSKEALEEQSLSFYLLAANKKLKLIFNNAKNAY